MNNNEPKLNLTEDKYKTNEQIVLNYLNKLQDPFITLTAKEVSKDLHIGINQAYDLFKQDDQKIYI